MEYTQRIAVPTSKAGKLVKKKTGIIYGFRIGG